MPKFDMTSIVEDIRSSIKDESKACKIGTGNALRQLTEADFIPMPDWWKKATGTHGMPFGRYVLVAGGSDSGKTSVAIQAIKAAQEHGCGIIYAETESKTNEQDFIDWGVDPSQIIVVQSTVGEELFTRLFDAWDKFKEIYPEAPLFVVVDSIGNMISMRDSEIDFMEQNSQMGQKGKFNRLALSNMIARMHEDNTAVLLISYTYDNMGSPGKTNAGGNALNFYSSLTYQTSRKGWYEKTIKGDKVRVGADVSWRLTKNHINKSNPGPKEVIFRITAEGIQYLDGSEKKKEKEDASG
jgi:RecA/RadA recombinase